MPWLPSSSSTRSRGYERPVLLAQHRQTCTCRLRGRSDSTELTHVSAPLRASSGAAPPAVASWTAATTSVVRASTTAAAPRADARASAPSAMLTVTTCALLRPQSAPPRQPDAAAGVHRDPLVGAQPALLHDRPEGRRIAAAERGGSRERQRFGQRDEVDVAASRATSSAYEPQWVK